MYKRILIATDGSELANRAVSHGLALAKVDKAPVSLMTVTDVWSAFDIAHDYDRGQKDPIGRTRIRRRPSWRPLTRSAPI